MTSGKKIFIGCALLLGVAAFDVGFVLYKDYRTVPQPKSAAQIKCEAIHEVLNNDVKTCTANLEKLEKENKAAADAEILRVVEETKPRKR